MGLDVGVVRIEYLDRPDKPTYDFVDSLYKNADELEWSVIDDGQVFVQTSRETLMERASAFASENSVAQSDVEGIQRWIESLPWRGSMLMLHLSW